MRNSTFICLAIVGGLMGIVDAAAPYIALKRVEPQSIVMDERVQPDKTMDEADDRVEIVGGLMGMLQAAAPYNAVKRVEPHSIVMDERVQPEKTVDEADDRVEMDPEIPYGYIKVEKNEPQMTFYEETMLLNDDDHGEAAVYSNVSIIETRRKRRCEGCHTRRPDDYFVCNRLNDKHAKIHCKGGYLQDCTQACSLVYSVRGRGRYNNYKCRDGEWHPHFEPCSMELQCQLRLEGRGSIDCNSSMNHGPRCKISCDRKGRHPAVHNREVECNKKGRWSASLPHCVLPFRTNW